MDRMDIQARRWIAVLAVVGVGVLSLAPAAFAQSSGTGYGGQSGVAGQTCQGGGSGGVAGETGNAGGGVAGATSGAAGNPNAASEAGEGNGVLAFTGTDIALLAGGGLLLLVTGFGLSRVVARSH